MNAVTATINDAGPDRETYKDLILEAIDKAIEEVSQGKSRSVKPFIKHLKRERSKLNPEPLSAPRFWRAAHAVNDVVFRKTRQGNNTQRPKWGLGWFDRLVRKFNKNVFGPTRQRDAHTMLAPSTEQP